MRPARRLLIATSVLVLLGALLLATCLPAPLALPAALAAALPRSLPAASPPAEMALYQLPTAVIPRNAAVAYRGGSPRDKRMFAMTAVLVRHPRGDLLIDTGLGRRVEAQFAQLPFLFRAMSPYQRKEAAVDQLRAVGYDPRQLRAILLTHAHWDHVSGIPDFPGTPVWVTARERRYISEGGVVTVVARSLPSVQYREYGFEAKPYLGFPTSHDVHGDGSVVVVPAPGHTPGSVIIFLTPPRGPRYAMVGDLA
jgi:N-acyl homoserine lactone hydrolase